MFRRAITVAIILVTAAGAAGATARGAETSPHVYAGLEGLDIGFLWYLSSQYGEAEGTDLSQFTIKRGYLNVRRKILQWGDNVLEARITPDVTLDTTGDLKMRLKYAGFRTMITMLSARLTRTDS